MRNLCGKPWSVPYYFTQSYFSGHTLKHLGQCYVQYINRTYKRSATNGNFALGSERFQNEIETD